MKFRLLRLVSEYLVDDNFHPSDFSLGLGLLIYAARYSATSVDLPATAMYSELDLNVSTISTVSNTV